MKFNLKEMSGNMDLPRFAQERVQGKSTPSATIAERNKATVKQFFSLLSEENIPAFIDLFAEDGKQVNPYASGLFPEGAVGKRALSAYWTPVPGNFDGMEFPIEALYALEDPSIIYVKYTGKIKLKNNAGFYQNDYYSTFTFNTEASVDLAQDQELMDLMVACNFGSVFLGIETPDEESLTVTKKFQNTRDPLRQSVDKILRSGLRIMAGFIIGFDGEKPGAGDRIVKFVQESGIPLAFYTLLQALPDTALWHRLKKEGRLVDGSGNINQTTLMNFIPTRPLEDIVQEYIQTFWQLYDPEMFLDRTYRCYRVLGEVDFPQKNRAPKPVTWKLPRYLLGVLLLCWKQGVVRKTRWKFWPYLFNICRHNPGGIISYLITCAYAEHFSEYRHVVRSQIEQQLAQFLAKQAQQPQPNAATAEAEPQPVLDPVA